MFVITCKVDQRIKIGEVEILVVKIKGKEVKLGIDAPQEISIKREEEHDH